MDTRQLAAFCAVVERRSFSLAAERLGVTQPAVSLQVRALEKRLGTQLLDRSVRRVEPTDAGRRLYRGAQRMLALEDQLVAGIAATGEGELAGELVLGASTGPAAIAIPVALCEFQHENPGVRLRDLDVRLELGLQESVRRAVEAGYGVTFISRTAIESDLVAGTLAEARVQGLEATREISLASASGRARSRVAEAFIAFARERLAS